MLLSELMSMGLEGAFDFVYLPIDHSTRWNVGYAFVNFKSTLDTERARVVLSGHVWRKFRQSYKKVAVVSDALIQGRQENVRHFSPTVVGSSGPAATEALRYLHRSCTSRAHMHQQRVRCCMGYTIYGL
eukprot:gnl/TRDRNA2_/TRDRNA2_167713_c0_seq2.p1 gnl/TRDRNA2_/TRDRNA2_167713_c0~~gnl/TRDRNA2_/TRDRNA2_167713_c0_seq2.p1  ORF type:complete len:129 (+),score=12.96 gnl/TRDRNA2_/TRDRNA2_167713_c0_seq2:2-388(+)